jgi:hypothetical protein
MPSPQELMPTQKRRLLLGSWWKFRGLKTARAYRNVERDRSSLTIPEKSSAALGEELPARRFRGPSYPLVAVLLLALGYGVYLTWRTSQALASVSDVTALGLRAERREDTVRISWNLDTPMVNQARDAVLSIRDGDLRPQPLHLTLAQLREGSVVYGPSKNSALVWLELTGPDNTKASETIVSAAPEAGSPARFAKASQPAVDSSSRNRTLSSPPGSQDDFGATQGILLVDPPAAPILRPEASILAGELPGVQPKFTLLPPPAPQPSGIAPQQPPTATAFVSAHAIHESQPNLPARIRATVTSDVEVQVKVQVDESGRVVTIDSVRFAGPASRSLIRATEEAARLWTFAPAMRGDKPVASEAILSFRYNPKTAGN